MSNNMNSKFTQLIDLAKDMIGNDTIIIVGLIICLFLNQTDEIIKLIASGFIGYIGGKSKK